LANEIMNRLVVVGLEVAPENFAQELENQMYGTAVPHEPGNLFVEVADGAFVYETSGKPKIRELVELSEKHKECFLLLSVRRFKTGKVL
jgi:hypothetical protein